MGYINNSRSVRSNDAIENYEMPLSMINKEIIDDFLNNKERDILLHNEGLDINSIRRMPVYLWKYVAKEINGRSSWHHTSGVYNRTDHYDLYLVVETFCEKGIDFIKEEYCKYRDNINKVKESEKENYTLAWIEIEVWKYRGGSMKHAYDLERPCVIVGKWAYYSYVDICKKGIYSNGASIHYKSSSYSEFVKKSKKKNLKKEFNKIIKHLKESGKI